MEQLDLPEGCEKIAIFANGQSADDCWVEILNTCSGVILVDGGANAFLKVAPLVKCPILGLVGDLDSITPESLEELKMHHPQMKIVHYERAKDFTDLEAALKLIKMDSIKQVVILNALGGRMDQTLGNIIYLTRIGYKGKVVIESPNETIFAIPPTDTLHTYEVKHGQTISLIPIEGTVEGVTTRGLQWELDDGTLDKDFLGISNVALSGHIQISVRKGTLLCFINRV